MSTKEQQMSFALTATTTRWLVVDKSMDVVDKSMDVVDKSMDVVESTCSCESIHDFHKVFTIQGC